MHVPFFPTPSPRTPPHRYKSTFPSTDPPARTGMDRKRKWCNWCSLLLCFPLILFSLVACDEAPIVHSGPLVTKEQRRQVVSTDSGAVTAVDVYDGYGSPYHLRFFSMEPNSLFLPVLLQRDMVFFVATGGGTISWVKEEKLYNMDISKGDVYRVPVGSVFYLRSHPDSMREKLRVHAIFGNIHDEDKLESTASPYSDLRDLISGFDDEILQHGFAVSEDVIESIKSTEKPPAIIPFTRSNETEVSDWTTMDILQPLVGDHGRSLGVVSNKKHKPFNVYKENPDVENCFGWSKAVTKKDLHALKGSNIGVFVVNLTKGSMMGPHWNPMASEISVVSDGGGMVQVVLPSNASGASVETERQSIRFRAKAGDVFVVRRYHPMAQMSFNNGSFVFMGFSTSVRKNYPQYLAGSRSVLQVVDRGILAAAFNVPNTTVDSLLAAQEEAIMMDCTSCAEEQGQRMEEEWRREEERRRREEEARRREEERRRQEEEARKQEEMRREEEERRREEEARRQEEEEEEVRRREEEEARRQEEEEKARRREEEEARRQEEEEARRREEEARRQEEEEEEEARREEEEEARRQEEEEEEARRQEEEEARRKEEEEAQRREEARRQEEEEETRRRKEEEARRQEEEEARRQEEEEEEGGWRRHEGGRRRRGEEEEEARRQEEEERRLWRRERERRWEEEGEEEYGEGDEGYEDESWGRWTEGGEEYGYGNGVRSKTGGRGIGERRSFPTRILKIPLTIQI